MLISWPQPAEKGAEILEYQIVIQTSDGVTFTEESVNCNGVDPIIVQSRSCEIPINILREAPYLLDYPDLVLVKVRSMNINGWSEYSDSNIEGAMILTEPATLLRPTRGIQTSQYQIHLEWQALEGDEIRGAYVTSYYLQWDYGTNEAQWYDLVGFDTQYLLEEYTTTQNDIAPG